MSLVVISLVIFILFSLYLVLPIIRQKDKFIFDENELKESLQKIYRNVSGEIFVHAGEANVNTYSQLKPIIESFLGDPEGKSKNRVIFVLGPVISVKPEIYEKLQKDIDNLSLKEIHPLFELLLDYSDSKRVDIYYKKDDSFKDINHFAIGGKYLYMEAFHKPLQERKAILVENPVSGLREKYEKFKRLLLNSKDKIIKLEPNEETLRELIKSGQIKFSDFRAA